MGNESRDRLPNFVIIGAAKAGTTSLARWLFDRSDVFLAENKEINFFSYEKVWARGVDWYRSRFATATQPAIGEASPSYLASDPAPARMASILPSARIVALLRDPVDRAVSHYRWRRNWQVEHRSLEDALRAEMTDPNPIGYLGDALYASHLRRWADHFPRESLLVVGFDALRDDPHRSYRRVCGHIHLDPGIVPETVGRAFNASTRVRSVRLWRLVRKRRPGWRGDPGMLARLLIVPDKPPPVPPALRAELVEWFRKDVADLVSWLGDDADGFPWMATYLGA